MSNFALVQIKPFSVVQDWQTIPDPVTLPNGQFVHAVTVGFTKDGWKIVPVVYTPDQPGEFYQITNTSPSFDGNTLTYTRTWSPMDLGYVQSTLRARIDADAENERLKYITPGSGQALTYVNKERQARAFLIDQSPEKTSYPLLTACLGVDGETLSDVASTIVARADQWMVIGSYLETVRLGAKQNVTNATTVDAAVDAAKAISWTLPSP